MKFTMTNTKVIGIDLGGTTVAAGVVEGTEILALRTIPTCREKPAGEIWNIHLEDGSLLEESVSIDGLKTCTGRFPARM